MESKSLVGKRYGMLTVLGVSHRDKNKCLYLEVICDCGKRKLIQRSNLQAGHTKSCGCGKSSMLSIACRKHGASRNRSASGFTVWTAMKGRCYNPNDPSFKNYGGRGITVCDRWLNSFENFIADMGHRPSGLSIDRIDNDGNYEPGNCRWANIKTQSINRRTTRHIEVRGTTHTIEEWSEISGIPGYDIYRRYTLGWDAERSVFSPVGNTGPKGKFKQLQGEL